MNHKKESTDILPNEQILTEGTKTMGVKVVQEHEGDIYLIVQSKPIFEIPDSDSEPSNPTQTVERLDTLRSER
jgi:hypothetical protein